jgi:hypothetical protein
MISEEGRPHDTTSSADSEKAQPTDWHGEDADRIRREVFKRMFPDVPEKPSE